MLDDRLESDLRELGRHLDVPPAPDVVAAVRETLAQEIVSPRPVPRRRRLWHVPRPAQAAAALVLLFGGLIAASPDVRAAAIDVLRFAGIEISDEPSPVGIPPDAEPLPGQRTTTLGEADEVVDFQIVVPTALGEPDGVTLADDRIVSLLYDARDGRQAILIDEFGGSVGPTFHKYVAGLGESVQIADTRGIWIDEPHPLLYVDSHGRPREESARMAASTLIWQVGGTVLRMEGDLTREQAIEIATSTLHE